MAQSEGGGNVYSVSASGLATGNIRLGVVNTGGIEVRVRQIEFVDASGILRTEQLKIDVQYGTGGTPTTITPVALDPRSPTPFSNGLNGFSVQPTLTTKLSFVANSRKAFLWTAKKGKELTIYTTGDSLNMKSSGSSIGQPYLHAMQFEE